MKRTAFALLVPLLLACGGFFSSSTKDNAPPPPKLTIPACAGIEAPASSSPHVPALTSSLQADIGTVDWYFTISDPPVWPLLNGQQPVVQTRRLDTLFEEAKPIQTDTLDGFLLLIAIEEGPDKKALAKLPDDVNLISTLTVGEVAIHSLYQKVVGIHGMRVEKGQRITLSSRRYVTTSGLKRTGEFIGRVLNHEKLIKNRNLHIKKKKKVRFDGSFPKVFDNGVRRVELRALPLKDLETRVSGMLDRLDTELLKACREEESQSYAVVPSMVVMGALTSEPIRNAILDIAGLVGWEHPGLQVRLQWVDEVRRQGTASAIQYNQTSFATFPQVGQALEFPRDRVTFTVEAPYRCHDTPQPIPPVDTGQGVFLRLGKEIAPQEAACTARFRMDYRWRPQAKPDRTKELASQAATVQVDTVQRIDGKHVYTSLIYTLTKPSPTDDTGSATFWISGDPIEPTGDNAPDSEAHFVMRVFPSTAAKKRASPEQGYMTLTE